MKIKKGKYSTGAKNALDGAKRSDTAEERQSKDKKVGNLQAKSWRGEKILMKRKRPEHQGHCEVASRDYEICTGEELKGNIACLIERKCHLHLPPLKDSLQDHSPETRE